MLLIRDPVVLLIYVSAVRERIWPMNGWVLFIWIYGTICLLQGAAQIAFGVSNVVLSTFGLRTLLLHLPLIWIVPEAWDGRDLRRVIVAALLIGPGLAMLMVAQFNVGSEHWLNKASLEGGTQIGSVGMHVRPAGAFSFITGPIHFFAFLTACVMYGLLSGAMFPRALLFANVVGIVAAMSVSGSRALVLACMVVVGSTVVVAFKAVTRAVWVIVGFAVVGISYIVLSRFSVIQEGHEVFSERWSGARESEGQSVYTRYLRTLTSSFEWALRVPVFGYGLGSTSNLAFFRYRIEAPVESEWERVVYELGSITSWPYLLFRAAISGALVTVGLRELRKGNFGCLLFASACCLDFLTGNFRQVTTHGFASMCAGICLLAARSSGYTEQKGGEPQRRSVLRPVGRGVLSIGRLSP